MINFSGGGPQIDPANDALVEAVHNLAAAGVVPVIAAGNDRDDFGARLRRLARARRPTRSPSPPSSNTHVFAPALDVTAPARPPRSTASRSRARTAARAGRMGDAPTRRSSTSARSPAPTASRSSASLRPAGALDRPAARCRRARSPARSRSSTAASARSPTKARAGEGARARSGSSSPTTARARRTASRSTLAAPGRDRSRTSTATRLRDYLAAHGGRTTIRVGRDPLELETGRSGVITSFSSAGPTAFGHDLKPDVSAPGGADPLVDAAATTTTRASPSSTARRWRRRTSPGRPRSCSQLHRLDAGAGQVGARLDRRARVGRTPRGRRRRP